MTDSIGRVPLALRGLGLIASLVACFCAALAGPGDPTALKFREFKVRGPPESSVDILFVGDGYAAHDLGTKYWTDVQRYAKRFLEEPPFSWYANKMNIRACLLESKERGCKQGPEDPTPVTALDSAFDSKGGRLLAFRDWKRLAEVVKEAGAVDIVFVMVNTERYGGAGTELETVMVRGKGLPAPTFAAQDTTSFLIAVHELGHSFGGLVDEYVDKTMLDSFPLPTKGDIPSPNVTLAQGIDAKDADSVHRLVKWAHFLDLPGAKGRNWLNESGYFREKGVFRPWPRCRMRDHSDAFCPICCEEMTKAILVASGEKFDDAEFHKAHPLSTWR